VWAVAADPEDGDRRLLLAVKHNLSPSAGGLAFRIETQNNVPRLAWEPIGTRLQALSHFNEQARWWQRLLVGFAEELELDGAGRVLISATLRKFAHLERQAILVGQGSHFELWDLSTWNDKLAGALTMAVSNPPPGAESFTL